MFTFCTAQLFLMYVGNLCTVNWLTTTMICLYLWSLSFSVKNCCSACFSV